MEFLFLFPTSPFDLLPLESNVPDIRLPICPECATLFPQRFCRDATCTKTPSTLLLNSPTVIWLVLDAYSD